MLHSLRLVPPALFRYVIVVNCDNGDHDSDDDQVCPCDNGRSHGVNLLGILLKGQENRHLSDASVLVWVIHVLVLHPEQGPLASAQYFHSTSNGFRGLVSKARDDTVGSDGEGPSDSADEVGDASEEVKPPSIVEAQVLSKALSGDVSPIARDIPSVAVEGAHYEHGEPSDLACGPVPVNLHIVAERSQANCAQRRQVLTAIHQLPLILSVHIPGECRDQGQSGEGGWEIVPRSEKAPMKQIERERGRDREMEREREREGSASRVEVISPSDALLDTVVVGNSCQYVCREDVLGMQ